MEAIETDDRDCLCDSHRDFMIRYIEFELERQEQVSERFPARAESPVRYTSAPPTCKDAIQMFKPIVFMLALEPHFQPSL